MLSLIISTFEPNGFYPISIETYFVFLLGTLSLYWGFVTCRICKKNEYIDYSYFNNSVRYYIDNKLILLLIIGMCIFCIPFVGRALTIAAIQGGAEMDNKDEIIFGGGNIVTILYNIGLAVTTNISLVTLVCSFILPNRRKRIVLILSSILLQILYTILSGGRGTMMEIVYIAIFVWICYNANTKKIPITFKKATIFASLFSLIFFSMVYVTNFRGKGDFIIDKSDRTEAISSMGLTFLNYTIVPINLLDISFRNNYFEKLNGPRLGMATFSGIDYLIQSCVKRFGIEYNTDLYIVEYLQDNHVYCAKDRHYNYAYSMFFYNYMDFGLLGVILIPFVFGRYMRWSIQKFYQKNTFVRLLFVVISLSFINLSHFTSPFIRPWNMFYLIILFFWDKYDSKHKLYKI